jgi:hypothetical protein
MFSNSLTKELNALPQDEAINIINDWLSTNGLVKRTLAYKLGHRDARHAAAQSAVETTNRFSITAEESNQLYNTIMNTPTPR